MKTMEKFVLKAPGPRPVFPSSLFLTS